MNVSNKTLLYKVLPDPVIPYKNPFCTGIGPLRDFFHELYLTLSITA